LKKNPSQKRTGGMAHGEDPEFKLQYWKKKKKTSSEVKARFYLQNSESDRLPLT
jgi:hypothetical protein